MLYPAYTPQFMPTPEQIAAKCLAIQATWSEQERQRRRYTTNKARLPRITYTIPVISLRDLDVHRSSPPTAI